MIGSGSRDRTIDIASCHCAVAGSLSIDKIDTFGPEVILGVYNDRSLPLRRGFLVDSDSVRTICHHLKILFIYLAIRRLAHKPLYVTIVRGSLDD